MKWSKDRFRVWGEMVEGLVCYKGHLLVEGEREREGGRGRESRVKEKQQEAEKRRVRKSTNEARNVQREGGGRGSPPR